MRSGTPFAGWGDYRPDPLASLDVAPPGFQPQLPARVCVLPPYLGRSPVLILSRCNQTENLPSGYASNASRIVQRALRSRRTSRCSNRALIVRYVAAAIVPT